MPSDIQNQSTCDKWWNLTHFGCKGAWRMVIRGMENGSRVAQRQNVLLTLNGPLVDIFMTYCLEKSFSPSLSLSFIYLFICLFIYLINNKHINITGIYLFIVLFWMSNFRQLLLLIELTTAENRWKHHWKCVCRLLKWMYIYLYFNCRPAASFQSTLSFSLDICEWLLAR